MSKMVRVKKCDYEDLESKLNEIGYNSVLQIVPIYEYDVTSFVIIYTETTSESSERYYNPYGGLY